MKTTAILSAALSAAPTRNLYGTCIMCGSGVRVHDIASRWAENHGLMWATPEGFNDLASEAAGRAVSEIEDRIPASLYPDDRSLDSEAKEQAFLGAVYCDITTAIIAEHHGIYWFRPYDVERLMQEAAEDSLRRYFRRCRVFRRTNPGRSWEIFRSIAAKLSSYPEYATA